YLVRDNPNLLLRFAEVAIPIADGLLQLLNQDGYPQVAEIEFQVDENKDDRIVAPDTGVVRPPPSAKYGRAKNGVREALDACVFLALAFQVLENLVGSLFFIDVP